MMQIVVDIPEETYNEVCWQGLSLCPRDEVNLVKAIRNSIALPKGHGRLIDADELLTVTEYDGKNEKTYVPYDEISNASTIIEADTRSEDKE